MHTPVRIGIGASVIVALSIVGWVGVAAPKHREHEHQRRHADQHCRAVAHASRNDADAIFGSAECNASDLIEQGRQVFRYDTFGDEAFWGGKLRLHEAVATLSPHQALDLGLKVDADALSRSAIEGLVHGKVDLDDPKVTAELLRANAVVGVRGSSTRTAR